jgi:ribosomal protein L16 Arg81 hydroxylase
MRNKLLNRLTPTQFLQRHWQKQPLLARNSLPQFTDLLSRRTLIELALLPEAEARLIMPRPGLDAAGAGRRPAAAARQGSARLF